MSMCNLYVYLAVIVSQQHTNLWMDYLARCSSSLQVYGVNKV